MGFLKEFVADIHNRAGKAIQEGRVALGSNYKINDAYDAVASYYKIQAKALKMGAGEHFDARIEKINAAREKAGKSPTFKSKTNTSKNSNALVAADSADTYSNWNRAKSLLYDADNGEFSYLRAGGVGIAGITGISAAGRIASGGGLYRDADGEFNIIGIPGI